MDGIGSHFTTERVKTGHSRPTVARASALLDSSQWIYDELGLFNDYRVRRLVPQRKRSHVDRPHKPRCEVIRNA
jgi:hypothetical protein